MALIEIDFNSGPIRDFLPILLTDRTTKKNIIFATDSYAHLGTECGAKCRITPESLAAADIRPRALKAADERTRRTRERAEVFTPAWVCRMMNDWCDEVWFGRKGVFDGSDPVEFPDGMNWRDYVNSQRLEITCGEAPYLVSRYDMNTGEVIPVGERAGILDRKLRVVAENTEVDDDWRRWALKAFQSVYGYEYQGDNLLIGRINLFMTYVEYTREIRTREPEEK
ncbi:MAG: restriction endonuclease subunit M, partial [Abditibacteriota bacterium]|nr:restriction endonuclease subunit M [Abditibacteriota bacterium]